MSYDASAIRYAQRQIISACLSRETWALQAIKDLSQENFDYKHGPIFKAIIEAKSAGESLTKVNIFKRLDERENSFQAAIIQEISPHDTSEREFMAAIKLLKEIYRKRKLYRLGVNVKSDSENGMVSNEILDNLMKQANEIVRDINREDGAQDFAQAVDRYDQFVEDVNDGKVKIIEFPPPFTEMQKIILYPSNQMVIGAHTSVGKTALSLHWAIHLARTGHRVLFISAEMDMVEMVERTTSVLAHIGIPVMRAKKIRLNNHPSLTEFENDLAETGGTLRIRYIPGPTEIEILSEIETMDAEGGIDILFLDYLQKIQWSASDYMNRRSQIIALSAWFQRQAYERGMVNVIMSQLSRPGKEDRYSKRAPTIWDLKEAGEIENDSHVVLILHREVRDSQRYWNVNLRCWKNKNGELCQCTYEFDNGLAQWG